MNRAVFAALVVFASACAFPTNADEEAIRMSVASYVEAFNQKKLETIGESWAERAVDLTFR